MNNQLSAGIYFDHAATSIPRCQAAIMAANAAVNLGNAGRGMYPSATTASQIIAQARQAIASKFKTNNSQNICFLANTTAALNQAILGLRPSPSCVAIDPLAHNATYRPLELLCRNQGTKFWILPHEPTGKIDIESLKTSWKENTDVVIITHASNVNGLIQPVGEVIKIAHDFGAVVIVDAAQTVGAIDVSVLAVADLIAFGAHKALRGLPGVGTLLVAAGIELEPLIYGGTGGDSAIEFMPEELPQRLEAGTANLPAIAALEASIKNNTINQENYLITSADLADAVQSAGGQLLPRDNFNSVPVVSFILPEIPLWSAAEILERSFDLQLRTGLHCAPMAHRILGSFPEGALRVSSGCMTTPEDLLYLSRSIHATAKSSRVFGHV